MTESDNPKPDPSDISINGELATEEELCRLEGLALSLLEGTVAETYYEYGYRADNGTTILFQTVLMERADGLEHRARISMNYDDFENPFLTISLDAKNSIVQAESGIDAGIGYQGVIIAMREIMDCEELSLDEHNLMVHLMTTLMNSHAATIFESEFMEQFKPTDMSAYQKTPLVDFLHDLVMNSTKLGVRVRMVTTPEGLITVEEKNYVGTMELEDTEEIPILEATIEDPETGKRYYYRAETQGERKLLVENVDEDDLERVHTDMDEEVDELAEDAGFYKPSKDDVARITELLSAAWLISHGIAPYFA